MNRTANAIYLGAALLIFGWTWSNPAVSLGHFQGPVLEYIMLAALMWGAGGLGLVCLALIRNIWRGATEPRFAFLKAWIAHHRRSRFAALIVPLLAFVLTMASFTVHKTVVLRGLGFNWDMALIELDRWLFFGADPWQISHGLLPGDGATAFLDKVYHAWFYPMILTYVFCNLMVVGPLTRACYIATYLISWFVIGCLLAAMFTSAGPAYDGALFDSGGVYTDLLSRLSEQSGRVGGIDSRMYQIMLLQGFDEGQVALGYGISAMPSMHVALATMWAMVLLGIHRWLGVFGGVYTLVIWVGSFHLGWHYAADGMLSSALVIAIWYAVRSVLVRFDTSQVSPDNADAPKAIPAE